ncbi:glycosyltransferase [Maribacter sp. 1_MG-2023]|uniref:glycosyltransferase n=1 Tax=Maribacter sp. 1_MG-2023 TaxID=3062677 RepID=UPI0026E2CAE9|nr:glycosyltransferase [Maribacter sp. 1_MG-2023]MDO6470713.1 glycosyltransferase [Maribacter sp. 1_MG-2023]
MFISIIIPIYNVEKYIYNCLQSVFNQQKFDANYEVIIVDDGSPDDSISIINTFKDKFENIKLIRQKNQGLSTARNVGLKAAVGQYVWFVDSDDTIKKNALELIYNTINSTKVDVIATRLNRVDELTDNEEVEVYPNVDGVIEGKEYLFKGYNSGASQRFIIKRDFLLKNNLFFMPNVYHEDAEFGPKMLYSTKTLYVLKEPIYNYLLRNSGSIMRNIKIKNLEDLVLIFHSLENFKKNYVTEEDKTFFEYRSYRNLQAVLSFSRNIWNNSDFISFYDEHKSLLKSKAKYLKIKNNGFKDKIKLILYRISPLKFYKLDYKLQEFKKN